MSARKNAFKIPIRATNRGQALGNDRFRDMIESAIGRRGEPKRGGRPRRGTGGSDGEQLEFGF